jgi:type 1 glutamine amidotransferase
VRDAGWILVNFFDKLSLIRERLLMKKWALVLMGLLAVTIPALLLAQTVATQPATQPAPIKLLVVTGGHGYQHDPFFQMFKNNHEVVYTEASQGKFTGTATAYDRDDLLSYDVVLLYDFQLNITDAAKKKFLSLFDKGTGLIVLHHALLSYQSWPEYERIAGGSYLLDYKKYPDKVWPASTYQGGVEMKVSVVDKDHPVTAGIQDFELKDELYRGVPTGADIQVLLTTEGKPLAWARTEKNSRVVTIMLGHGPGSYDNPNFLKLLGNAIRWTAKRN